MKMTINNNSLEWPNNENSSEESWLQYFQLLLTNIEDIMTQEYHSELYMLYDDPKDFINGFTLAGAFFSGLHLEFDSKKRKNQIVMFRTTLATHLVRILDKLEQDERGV